MNHRIDIQVGRVYDVFPQKKYETQESITFYNGERDLSIVLNLNWKRAELTVVPVDESEVELLHDCVNGDAFQTNDFTNAFLDASYDGGGEQIVFEGDGWTPLQRENILDQWDIATDLDDYSKYDFFESLGFEEEEVEWIIWEGIDLQESERRASDIV